MSKGEVMEHEVREERRWRAGHKNLVTHGRIGASTMNDRSQRREMTCYKLHFKIITLTTVIYME